MSKFAGCSPRSVIRGESISPRVGPQLSVLIDYLSFTVPGGSVLPILAECKAFLGVATAEDRGRGMFGYSSSIDLDGYGVIAYGGENQRGTVLVSINGAGCSRVADFGRVGAWAESLGARITRVDLAADDHKGRVFTVAKAIAAFRQGGFNLGGRPPASSLHDDMGSGRGCTLYVGSRVSGKLCRVYEKGKQLGDGLSKWVRGEVELHAKDRVIPWQVLKDPVQFLAGSYPFFEFLSLVVERIKTAKKSLEISIEAVQRWVRLAAGKSINCLVKKFEGDIGGMFEALRRDGAPKRLRGFFDSRALV